jgi:hypothetical protein
MRVNEGVPPPGGGTAALLEALLDVFAPLDVRVGDDLRIARLDPVRTFGTTPLWCDEELTRGALTRCKPTLGTDVVAELYERALGTTAIVARGAIRLEDGWYGRWCNAELRDVVEVRFSWPEGFALELPLRGFPFTATRPLAKRLDAGDPAVAAAHRALWLPALCQVRTALGLDREEVRWETTLGKDFLRALAAS